MSEYHDEFVSKQMVLGIKSLNMNNINNSILRRTEQ